MKWMIIFITIVMSVSFTQLVFSNEQPDGLIGMKWGESIEQCKERGLFKKIQTKDGNIVMVFGKSSSIGEVNIPVVFYSFIENKLRMVSVGFLGNTNFNKLKVALKSKYGNPESIEPRKNAYGATIGIHVIWNMSEVKIEFQYNGAKEEGIMQYLYKPLFKLEEKEIKEFEKTKKEL